MCADKPSTNYGHKKRRTEEDGQRKDSGGQRTNRRRIKDRQRTDSGGQRTDSGGQRTDSGGQRTNRGRTDRQTDMKTIGITPVGTEDNNTSH